MAQTPDTALEIDLTALEHNYRLIRSGLRPGTRFLGVVKAFAYGSEDVAIARKLEALGADYLAVAFIREGVALRQQGIRMPILVLHPQPGGLGELIDHCLEPSLYSRGILTGFLEAAQKQGQRHYPVHLKFNTGLNRLGFPEDDLEWIRARLSGSETLTVRSIFSHLAASDDPKEREFTLGQIRAFESLAGRWDELAPGTPIKHLLNTSGIFNYPQAQADMVRCGIGLYGYANDPEIDARLRPVARLRTRISQIHDIEPGQWVGYNKGYQALEKRRTATLPVGHADGIGRQYGKGRGWVTIGGERAPILGNVCMDMTMVDITGIACEEGDEAIFFGPGHSAETFAGSAGTISYELLAGISRRVPRIIVET
jgi:alanine racemase